MFRFFIYLAITLTVITACTGNNDTFNPDGQNNFATLPLQSIANHALLDLGAADINGDGWLDIFTTNHSSRQSLLVNHEGEYFSDEHDNYGLSQTRLFPSVSLLAEEPPTQMSGVYVYLYKGKIVIANKYTNQPELSISVHSQIELRKEEPNDWHDRRFSEKVEKADEYVFMVRYNNTLRIAPKIISAPFLVEIDSSVQNTSIFVGNSKANPQGNAFKLYVRDRHGMAWVDYDSDGQKDVFIARGGMKGQIDDLGVSIQDEFLTKLTTGPIDIYSNLGFIKGNCPGRQVAWVDYNADDLLDLYVSCGRTAGSYPNRLYANTGNNMFVDVASKVGLDINEEGNFIWSDVDQDLDTDLLWVSKRRISLFRNKNSHFETEHIADNYNSLGSAKITASDYDNDGDIDYFIANGSTALLENMDGKLVLRDPSRLGLPSRAITANWVDFDNDGLVDIHLLPGGLYRQHMPGDFRKLDSLAPANFDLLSIRYLKKARAEWVDFDNNGSRDVVMWYSRGPNKLGWRGTVWTIVRALKNYGWTIKEGRSFSNFFSNQNNQNNWLQINLQDGCHNPRDAIGASVLLESDIGSHRAEVGSAGGSHYSQGHYRLYFGLGQARTASKIEVHWSDGSVRVIEDISSNQIFNIQKNDICQSDT